MENNNKWNEEVFIINYNNEVESMTYGEFAREFGSDKTTSPRGLEPRIHIREKSINVYKNTGLDGDLIDEEDYDNLDEEEQETYFYFGERQNYEIWSWGIGGNHPTFTGTTFESEEEADNDILEHFEYYCQNKNDNAPSYFSTEEEAEEERISMSAEAMGVDIEVFLSIERKQKMVAGIRAERIEASVRAFKIQESIVFEKYKNIIERIEGESYNETKDRLAKALPEKINGSTFHKIIKQIR